jgi:pimeloyl-ACP methyl ester carboxylesterase
VEAIVLVHGLWMRGPDMTLLRLRLRRCGFTTYQFSYKTRHCSVDEAAQRLNQLLTRIEEPVVHFVAHSLGGLVVQRYCSRYPLQRPGRVVTLGTPHQGSAVARRIAGSAFGRFFLGKSYPGGLVGSVTRWSGPQELGVIAGDLSLGGGRVIGGLARPNDGTVSVAETCIAGATAHIVVHTSHMGLVVLPKVAQLTCAFLRSGSFDSSVSSSR